MKNIITISVLLISQLLYAKIDFSKYIDFQQKDIRLSVTNVNRDDVLNLREKPSVKSKIIYHIPYDAKNIITYDKDILKKIKKNLWTPIEIRFSEGYFTGWVKGKYLKIYEKYSAINSDDLLIIYPSFLEATKKNEWIRLTDTIDFEHYSSCNEKLLDELRLFDLSFKVYYSLWDAFEEVSINNYKEITKNGWFKNRIKNFKKVNYYGLRGFKKVIGNKECGINIYFFKIKGKVLVIKEPFDLNTPILKKRKKINNKKNIINYVIHNLRVF